ncbi:hypothetical protein [Streptomyces rishiriensis]|uniref:Uncharacterized protein n=1 Tax=Streptomyces rishiriensis TaxID=68264 RepID=A0ABU0NGP7_STRRH|nr:hypothetical protein [Streptomyces rishiriensis]MDQ0577978.1 hypothetical protein [Streptomyces rishiriensis]
MRLGTAAPASAGGIGDFLSPAFGVSCANLNNGAHANGTTTQGTGAANGNLAGLPLGGALNQCGGADLSLSTEKFAQLPLCAIAPCVVGT